MSEEMIDMTDTIIPKTDQMNYDCLVDGPRTITVTGVKNVGGEQPIIINYDGDDGRPYKPCMGMRRLLVYAWGKNGAKYIGRKLTLFGNPQVKWGGKEQGGIQISHLSHIKKPFTFMLTISKGKKEPFKCDVIETEVKKAITDAELKKFTAALEASTTLKELQEVGGVIGKQGFDVESSAKIKAIYKAVSSKLRESSGGESNTVV